MAKVSQKGAPKCEPMKKDATSQFSSWDEVLETPGKMACRVCLVGSEEPKEFLSPLAVWRINSWRFKGRELVRREGKKTEPNVMAIFHYENFPDSDTVQHRTRQSHQVGASL